LGIRVEGKQAISPAIFSPASANMKVNTQTPLKSYPTESDFLASNHLQFRVIWFLFRVKDRVEISGQLKIFLDIDIFNIYMY